MSICLLAAKTGPKTVSIVQRADPPNNGVKAT